MKTLLQREVDCLKNKLSILNRSFLGRKRLNKETSRKLQKNGLDKEGPDQIKVGMQKQMFNKIETRMAKRKKKELFKKQMKIFYINNFNRCFSLKISD